jgi:hypothetical protein
MGFFENEYRLMINDAPQILDGAAPSLAARKTKLFYCNSLGQSVGLIELLLMTKNDSLSAAVSHSSQNRA